MFLGKLKLEEINYLEVFFILLTLSIRGFISFATVPWRLSRSLCIIADDSPNSPIFPRTACCNCWIEFSILFSLSSILLTWFWIWFLNDATSPTFDL